MNSILTINGGSSSIKLALYQIATLGRPNPNAVKFFSAIELFALLAEGEWLDEATKPLANSGSGRISGVMV